MKIRELFSVGDPTQSIDGAVEFLDHTNCVVENKRRDDNTLLLRLKRESDGREGDGRMKVRPEFKDAEEQLLGWAMNDARMIGLTLNDIEYLDTNISITSIGAKMMFSRKGD
jgi:hypothetical protein